MQQAFTKNIIKFYADNLLCTFIFTLNYVTSLKKKRNEKFAVELLIN